MCRVIAEQTSGDRAIKEKTMAVGATKVEKGAYARNSRAVTEKEKEIGRRIWENTGTERTSIHISGKSKL